MSRDKMNVLVTGGAGYIGSHAVKLLVEQGYGVTVVDNLFRGHRPAVHSEATFHKLDIRETDRLSQVIEAAHIDAVLHFAAFAYVGESVSKPLDYYDNNVGGTISLLKAMHRTGVRRLVFSSTCATYGEPAHVPISETCPQSPISPYGRSKHIVEQVLRDYCGANPAASVVMLRYFNVAGCAEDGSLGEDHTPETHLIPILMDVALQRRESVTVFGTDYPTDDGTCVRDYVHVEDLCTAHLIAMEAMEPGAIRAYNVGIGRGYSVRQVIDAAMRVTGRTFPIVEGERRAGDPPELFADARLIRKELGWYPRYESIDEIVETAWKWFCKHPHGYAERTASTK